MHSRITTEIFSIPHGDNFIVYAPLKSLVFLVSPGVVRLIEKAASETLSNDELEMLKPFTELGIIDGEEALFCLPEATTEAFLPAHVALFPTNQCNLRCIYCYGSGGSNKKTELSAEIAKAAIEFVVENAMQLRSPSFGVSFHGAGEPTLAWDLFVETVEHIREIAKTRNLEPVLHLTTNGIIPEDKLKWIAGKFQIINISFDGPGHIQDRQRPLANGEGSFAQVMRTFNVLDQLGFPYCIRTTVTNASVKFMSRTIEFLADNCNPKSIRFEPVYYCGRCLSTEVSPPLPDDFIEGYRAAMVIAMKRQIKMSYSGARTSSLTTSFCRASIDSFCITPEGHITACHEVCSLEHPMSRVFFYGKWSPVTKAFELFPERLQYLRARTVKNVSFCKDCFCRYHCAGDCMVKAADQGDIFRINNNDRCRINQALTKDMLLKQLSVPPPRAC